MHARKRGDEVWALFYDRSSDNYVAKLDGHIATVGRDGFTMRRLKPDHEGKMVERVPHYAARFPSKALADAHIAAHPFSTGPRG